MNDKKIQYNLEYFLNNDSFISYVRNNDPSEVEFWENWLLEHPEKAKVLEEAKLVINSIRFKEEKPSQEQIENIWEKIESGIGNKETNSKNSKIRFIQIATGIAASILLLISVLGIWNNKNNVTVNSIAEKTSVVLPDNSLVELNENSKISYNKKQWGKERKVKLSGEAFFKVTKGNKFSVVTKKIIVEVLGTSFNVIDKKDRADVRCETGKVRVISRDRRDTVVLSPGFGAKLSADQKLQTYTFEIHDKNKLNESIISFEDKTLKFVFDELEKQYNVEVIIDDKIANRIFTGQLILNDLDKSIYSICWPMHLKYKVEGKKVYIFE